VTTIAGPAQVRLAVTIHGEILHPNQAGQQASFIAFGSNIQPTQIRES